MKTRAGPWARALRQPARGGAVMALAILVLFAARESGNNLLLLLAAALVAATVLAKAKGRRLVAGVELQASAPPGGIFAGRDGAISFAVTSRRGPIVMVLAHPMLGPPRPAVATEVASRLEVVVRPARRGPLALDGLVVRSHGPWGLTSQTRRIAIDRAPLVYPEPAAAFDLRRLLARRRQPVGTPVVTRSPGAGSDFLLLRDHRPEDGLRRVHWRASARVGSLVAKVHEDEEPRTLTFVLDRFIPDASPEHHARFEAAVSEATAAVLQAHARGLRYALLIPGHRHVTGEGAPLYHGALAALATVAPEVGPAVKPRAGSVVFAAHGRA